jgi:vitamin B12 transporter
MKAGLGYEIPRLTTKIYGSYGEGFKAPSLYQLFDATRGNRDLKPEESKNWQAGLIQPFSDNISFSFCYFHSDFKNLIDFVYTNPTFWVGEFKNADRGKSEGIELELNYRMAKKLNFKSGYTYTRAKQDFVDEDMVTIFSGETLRIPKHKAFLGISWEDEKIEAFFNLSFVGLRTDRIWMGMTDAFVQLKPYFLANLAFNYNLTANKTFFLKIDNILNKNYERIKGYQEEKVAFYGGLKMKF